MNANSVIRATCVAALLAVILACASLGLDTHTKQIEAGCATAATALKALTVANDAGKLDDTTKGAVIKAVGVITPICTADNPPTLDSVKQEAFAQAIAQLQLRAAKL